LYNYNTTGVDLNQVQSDLLQVFVSARGLNLTKKPADLHGHMHSLQTTNGKVLASTYLRANLAKFRQQRRDLKASARPGLIAD